MTTKSIADYFMADMTFPCCPMHELWDNDPDYFLSELDGFRKASVNFVSITVGLDHYPDVSFQLKEIGRYRNAIASAPEKFLLVHDSADIHAARTSDRLAVALHFQGTNMLQGDLNLVDVYRQLGITPVSYTHLTLPTTPYV